MCVRVLQTIPAGSSALSGDTIRPARLDGIILHNKMPQEHLTHIREVLKLLVGAGYSAEFHKLEFCWSEVGFSGGVAVCRDGTRVAPLGVKALQEMEMPTNVGKVRDFLGIAGVLRSFVPDSGSSKRPFLAFFATSYQWGRARAGSRGHGCNLNSQVPPCRTGSYGLCYTVTQAPWRQRVCSPST